MKNSLVIIFLFVLLLISADLVAQCPMCKAAAEASLSSDSKINIAFGLNKGIFYLFFMPYVLISGIFLVWYYNHRKHKELTA